MNSTNDRKSAPKVAIIGAGIAGSTAAIHLAEQGVNVHLIEKSPGLVSGPPICHLHAGGNLYREISLEQCLELLTQSINSVRLYPHTLNRRPTLIVVPKSDGGDPNALLPRLHQIQSVYQKLVEQDSANKVLGEPSDYYKLYYREDLEALKHTVQPEQPQGFDEWLIPFADQADLDGMTYPVVAVQEHGWSVFRIAATASLVLEQLDNCQLSVASKVVDMAEHGQGWDVTVESGEGTQTQYYDYVINACGFKTGSIDDLVAKKRSRLVEFKAAYVTHWSHNQYKWPEVIFHGPRGSKDGMAQLTPYANNVFQLHGMTKDITLFEDGLVTSNSESSQPNLPLSLENKIEHGWPEHVQISRSVRAIEHMSRFVPDYASAKEYGTPLFGAQQIPGDDDTLRAADVSFDGDNYARLEIVKGSSAIEAAMKIAAQWGLVKNGATSIEEAHPVTMGLTEQLVVERAKVLASQRSYPVELAEVYGEY